MAALTELFFALNGSAWKRSENWGRGHPCKDRWQGIVCCPTTNPTCLEERRRERRLQGANARGLTSDPYCIQDAGECLIAYIDLSNNSMNGELVGSSGNSPFATGALRWVQELDLSNNRLMGRPMNTLAEFPRLQRLLISNNLFNYLSMPDELLRACAAPLGLVCTGLPQQSCSAVAGPYRVALEDFRGACVHCGSPMAALMGAVVMVFQQVVLGSGFALAVVAYPDLLQKHLSSFGLLLSFIDVAKILRHSRVPWSPTMRRVLSLLSISVSGYDEASPECLLDFLPEDVAYYYYYLARLLLAISQLVVLWLVRCATRPCARRRRAAWLQMATVLEKAGAEDLVPALDAASISSTRRLKRYGTIPELLVELRTATAKWDRPFDGFTQQQIGALRGLGLNPADIDPPRILTRQSATKIGALSQAIMARTRADATGSSTPRTDTQPQSPPQSPRGFAELQDASDELEQLKQQLQRARLALANDATAATTMAGDSVPDVRQSSVADHLTSEEPLGSTSAVAVRPALLAPDEPAGGSPASVAPPPSDEPTGGSPASIAQLPSVALPSEDSSSSKYQRSAEASQRLAAIQARNKAKASRANDEEDGEEDGPRARGRRASPPPSPPSADEAWQSAFRDQSADGSGQAFSGTHMEKLGFSKGGHAEKWTVRLQRRVLWMLDGLMGMMPKDESVPAACALISPAKTRSSWLSSRLSPRIDTDHLSLETFRELALDDGQKLKTLFNVWDEDASGTISSKEFRSALKSLGITASDAHMDALFDKLDKDRSGQLNYREMITAIKAKPRAKIKRGLVMRSLRAMIAHPEKIDLAESIILDRTMVDVWIAAAALMSTYHAGLHGKCTSSYCTPGTHVYELSLPTFVLNLMTTDDH